MKLPTKKLAIMALLSALSIVLVALIHFPIFPAMNVLEYDPADIPVLITAFMYGPLAGLAVTLVVSVIQGLTVSAAAGVYGIIMHFLATGTLVLTAGLIYGKHKSRKRAVIGLLCGTLAMTAVMAVANLIVTPLYYHMPVSAVRDMLLPFIIPFNLIKASGNSLLTFVIYKRISKRVTH